MGCSQSISVREIVDCGEKQISGKFYRQIFDDKKYIWTYVHTSEILKDSWTSQDSFWWSMKWQLEVFSIFRVWIARTVSEIFYPNLPIQEKIDTFCGFLGKSATENFVEIFGKWHSNLKMSSDPGNSPKLPQIPSSICDGHLTSRVSPKYPKTSPKPFKAFFNLGARDISRKFPLNSRRFPNFLDFF